MYLQLPAFRNVKLFESEAVLTVMERTGDEDAFQWTAPRVGFSGVLQPMVRSPLPALLLIFIEQQIIE
jgi:hypothetical protein